jgi:hypothetical protein
VVAAAATPSVADAHGLVGKQDLPIPAWLFTWGAAAVLVASFMGLAALWSSPRLQVLRERLVARIPSLLTVLAGAAGVAAFAAVIYAGFAGVQEATSNLTPEVVYVVFWVGGSTRGWPSAGPRAGWRGASPARRFRSRCPTRRGWGGGRRSPAC